MVISDELYDERDFDALPTPIDIGRWRSYDDSISNEAQLEMQKENLLPVGGVVVVEGNLKFIYTNEIDALCDHLEMVSEEIPVEDTSVSLETEVFFTSKIEGAKTTRIRTSEIHAGAPIDPRNKTSELMVLGGFKAVKLLNSYGNEISKDILCKVWSALVDGCCENEEIRGDKDSYRIGNVRVGSHEGVPFEEVERLMDKWIEFYNGDELCERPFLKAALLHYAFENIHPFCDGNGRMGRLLMNNFLIKSGIESAKAVSFSMEIDKSRSLYDWVFVQAENTLADCTPFIEYMLETMARAYIVVQQS